MARRPASATLTALRAALAVSVTLTLALAGLPVAA
jgi:hypothetical protein